MKTTVKTMLAHFTTMTPLDANSLLQGICKVGKGFVCGSVPREAKAMGKAANVFEIDDAVAISLDLPKYTGVTEVKVEKESIPEPILA
jgi:hypothetical protein